jgi:hypothetical protein
MTDELRNANGPVPEELTTKDLAEAGESKSRKFRAEPLLAAKTASSADQSECRGDAPRPGSGTAAAAVRGKAEEELGPLFPADEANNLRAKWDSVQVKFVDEPRQAVEDADVLIAATMKRLAEIFAGERQKLEHQWDRGGNVSTEDLRLGLRRYRSFFSRLLKV